jgi:hypothetical protein
MGKDNVLEGVKIIEHEKINYFYMYLIEKDGRYIVQRGKIDYYDDNAMEYMFDVLGDAPTLEEGVTLYEEALDLLKGHMSLVESLNEIFKGDRFMKNKNLTKGNIVHPMSQELSDFRVKEIARCMYDPVYFIENYYYIISPKFGKGIITMYEKQRELLKCMINNNRVVTLASRQVGKTTSYCMFICYMLCFQKHKNVILLANKLSTSKGILRRIKFAFELLPKWLKPGVTEWNKESITLTNGCTVKAFAASSDGARSEAANVLVIDEMAFVPNNVVDELWGSAYPTISSSKDSKVILVSTPNGTGNKFYELYNAGITKEGRDDVLEKWTPFRIDWWDVPDRDEEWKQKQIVAFNYDMRKFNQEFGNCAGGKTLVTVKDKYTGEIFDISLEELYAKVGLKAS